jgi:pyridoxamine 5'-phosphate oxidase
MKTYADLEEDFPEIRKEYSWGKLNERDLVPNPFDQFEKWFLQAVRRKVHRPHVVTFATATERGRPSARTVLVKGFDSKGFVFYTHYLSTKARELARNPRAALLFYWPELDRQVIVSGRMRKTSRHESESYFRTRPRGAQLMAWASEQSRVIRSRAGLERKMREAVRHFAGRPIPAPPFWGGYRLLPNRFEFFQGRKNRLNDRLQYRLAKHGWITERLQP